ncbi:MAG TPA: (d)CMP kinase [Ruminococcaceae bacterium]|nr:(d)CMP kinase [Oscillospiraceae bacterium]
MFNIAIDGPAGAGKSTLSRKLAERLGFVYADTGALYRAVGLYALRHGVQPDDAPRVEKLLQTLDLKMELTTSGQRILMNGENVSALIRTPEVSTAASCVSAIPSVRAFLLDLQKNVAKTSNIVMDGRDIGTIVLPDAELKIFLTASAEDRAGRRFAELTQKGLEITYPEVLREVKERDQRDTTRAVSPLCAAKDAVVVNTTGYELERSLERLYQIAKERLK